jgi:Mce-associated membrane protein
VTGSGNGGYAPTLQNDPVGMPGGDIDVKWVEQAEAEVAAADTNSGATETDGADAEPTNAKARRLRRPRWTTLVISIAAVCTCVLFAASVVMTFQHRQVVHTQQRSAEFAGAARQVVITLMSIDYTKVHDDVQRIVDSSTGKFRDDFEGAADDFIKAAEDARVSTTATVQAAAVESMTDNSAVVLVAATSTATGGAGASDPPRSWRLSINLIAKRDQIKMSSVEFVP